LLAPATPALAQCFQSTCSVSSESDLASAINYANANPNTIIAVQSDITLSGNLPTLQGTGVSIIGNNHTLSGNDAYRGLFVESGSVRVETLTISDAAAQGGDGQDGGGGGAGLGGALFVQNGASVTVRDVEIRDNMAVGGDGSFGLGGGGGGLYGSGGKHGGVLDGGGGGGGGSSGNGGDGSTIAGTGGAGGAGGGGAGGAITEAGNLGLTFGGGGGAGTGGSAGGFGGFAGGGGAANFMYDPDDPYGLGGNGGFAGGGGAGEDLSIVGAGGFAGGDGFVLSGGGGGGLGGGIFVMNGGTLVVEGNLTVDNNTVAGGSGGASGGDDGAAYGAGLFLQGDGALTFTPGRGATQTISDIIADQTGQGGTGPDAGSWSLVKQGAGTLALDGANTFSGGVTIKEGTLKLGSDTAAGGGTITTMGSVIAYADGIAVGNAIDINSDSTQLGVAAGTATQSGDISQTSGPRPLEKIGGGTLILSGTNSFTGQLTVSGGTLELRNEQAVEDSVAVDVARGAALSVHDTETIGSLAGGGNVAIASGKTLTTGGNDASTTFSGVISGDASLLKAGSGTMVLAGANTYAGGTTISGGTLQIGSGGTSGSIVGYVTNNGTLAFDRSDTYTFGNLIIGSGDLRKLGEGVLILSGNNLFTGGVTVAEGTLRLESDTAAGGGTITTMGSVIDYADGIDISNSIDLNSGTTQLKVDAGTATQSGGISETSGPRPLTKTGAGALVLSSTNTFTGLLEVAGGTLELQGGAAVADTGPVSVASGATLAINGSETIGPLGGNGRTTIAPGQTLTTGGSSSSLFAGVISGDGALVKAGSGTMILAGKNTYAGGTTISAGTLQIGLGGNTGSIEGDVINNGTLTFDRFDTYQFDDDISGTGDVRVTGRGKLILNGTNTYTGDTFVTGGDLAVNGSMASAVTVGAGAVFQGTGSVGALTINSGGVHAPGNSIGTQTVNGNYLLSPRAHLVIEADAAGQADKVAVSAGSVTLADARLRVLSAFGDYSNATDYIIIDNDGIDAVTGTFGSVGVSSPFLDASVDYAGGDGNDVVLTLARNELKMVDLAETPNERAVAYALDQFPLENPVFEQVFFFDGDTARNAYNALSGEVHATLPGVLANQSWFVRQTVLSRLVQAYHASTGMPSPLGGGPITVATLAPGAARSSDSPMMGLGMGREASEDTTGHDEAPLPAYGAGLTFWTQGFGSWGLLDGNANAASAKRTLGGFLSGVDMEITNSWRAGLATGYTQTSVGVEQRQSSADVKSYNLVAYGGGDLAGVALKGAAAWTWHGIDSARAVTFPGFYEEEEASYNGNTGQAFGEAALPMQFGVAALEPFAGGAYVHVATGGFTESGSNVALTSSGSSENLGYTTLGMRAAMALTEDGAKVTPRLSFSWQHAFGALTPETAMAFNQYGIGMGITGVPIAQDTMLIEAGLGIELGPTATFNLSYQGQFAGDVQDNGLTGSFAWQF